MVTPKKTPSGKWRARVYLGRREDGRPVYGSVTADTKKQCINEAALLKAKGVPREVKPSATLGELIDRYIESSETLSPTTLAGYRKIRRTMFQDLMPMKISDLSDESLQRAINAEMRRKSRRGHNVSAKSIRNAYGLVRAVLGAYTSYVPRVKLPELPPRFLELPEPDFVIQAVRGTDIELPCMLALWLSLSMSEVRGLKYSSIRRGCIYVDQVVVDVDGIPVEKANAKVASRNRVLKLHPRLLDLIRRTTDYSKYEAGRIFDDYLVPFREYQIRRKLNKLLPGVSFHQLRHMNASVMLKLGVPDKYAMERGGWSTDRTMKTVYQHTFSSERQRIDDLVDGYFVQKYDSTI